MKEENLCWWREEARRMEIRKHPRDLATLRMSDEDYVDAAIVCGVRFKDIVEGRIALEGIPDEVIQAYHQQYPRLGDLVREIHRLHGNTWRLRGLAEGIKGKLFEDRYVDWLNHGHLPRGATAALAASPTNPAWDIRITDAHGNVLQELQLKATNNMYVVEHALKRYPGVDVVTTREVFEQVERHRDLIEHVVDSDLSNQTLDHIARHAVDVLDNHDLFAFHVPVLSIAVIAGIELRRYRSGDQDIATTIKNMRDRSFLSVISVGAAWIATGMSGEPLVGLPIGFLTRLGLGWARKELEFRRVVKRSLLRLGSSNRALAELYPARPALLPQT